MKSGPFIKLVSDAYRIEEKTVSIVARFLKDAGLLSMGARGRNAPHMTSLDAARLTIALLATEKPARAVEMTRIFCNLTVNHDCSRGRRPHFANDASYSASLEDVLRDFFEAHSVTFVELNGLALCEETQEADIECGANGEMSVHFDGEFQTVKSLMAGPGYWGRRTTRSLTNLALRKVSIALKEGENNGSQI